MEIMNDIGARREIYLFCPTKYPGGPLKMFRVIDCAQARLALSAGLISPPLQSAEQGTTALRSYLEKWTNPQDRLAAVRDLLVKCDDDEGSRNMSEDSFRYITSNLNT